MNTSNGYVRFFWLVLLLLGTVTVSPGAAPSPADMTITTSGCQSNKQKRPNDASQERNLKMDTKRYRAMKMKRSMKGNMRMKRNMRMKKKKVPRKPPVPAISPKQKLVGAVPDKKSLPAASSPNDVVPKKTVQILDAARNEPIMPRVTPKVVSPKKVPAPIMAPKEASKPLADATAQKSPVLTAVATSPVPVPVQPKPEPIPVQPKPVSVPVQPKQVPVPIQPKPVSAMVPLPVQPKPVPESNPSGSSAFVLGKLTSSRDGVRLSQGLTAKIIARSGDRVGETPSRFHGSPDGAAVFSLDGGRFVYVSNSEETSGRGGVYGLEFDADARILGFKSLLSGTTRNCNGGKTPWNTWVSCEEDTGGQCWQVDPTGKRSSQQIAIGGSSGGAFEAFAYDARNPSSPSFYVTEDATNGALRRFRPNDNTPFEWNMLHSDGTIDYLQFLPDKKFRWTSNKDKGRQSASDYYKNSEGIAQRNGILKFVSKAQREMFRLDLDQMTYSVMSTSTSGLTGGGVFDAEPDHLIATSDGFLYFTEDGGSTPGVFVHDGSKYLALLESDYGGDEVTGIAFSPDRRFMFFCMQERGLLFQVSREDGQPFDGGRVL